MSIQTSTHTVLVIFGITGDLSRRYLLPSLFQLLRDGSISAETLSVVGVSRRDVMVDDLIAEVQIDTDSNDVAQFQKMITMFQMDLVDPAGYVALRSFLEDRAQGSQTQFLHYLSMPPQVFGPVVDNLGAAGLNATNHRLLVEKPFGFDLQSAQELIDRIGAQYSEEQVYRIDHYLAKETAQNILTFRFSNPLFASIWNGQNIDRIIVNASESIGIEGRGTFYEQTGALRDFIQSHLLQLLALVTMEEPEQLDSASVHAEKVKLLRSIVPVAPDQVEAQSVRAQYEGYKEEAESPHSETETFAAVKLQINNERWQNVPMILQTGKALAEREADITLVFKDPVSTRPINNHLVIKLQPNEGIGLTILVKKPGLQDETELVEMDFRYERSFSERYPKAYERVLADAIRGDQTLFASSEEVLLSWKIVENIIHAWMQNGDTLRTYKRGTAADDLAKDLTA